MTNETLIVYERDRILPDQQTFNDFDRGPVFEYLNNLERDISRHVNPYELYLNSSFYNYDICNNIAEEISVKLDINKNRVYVAIFEYYYNKLTITINNSNELISTP